MISVAILGFGQLGNKLGIKLIQKKCKVFAVTRDFNRDVNVGKRYLPAYFNPSYSDKNLHQSALSNSGYNLNTDLLYRDGCDYLVICVAPRQRTPESYQTCYVDAPSRFLVQLSSTAQNRLRRVFFVSSTAIYGSGIITEHSQPKPVSWNGNILLEAEKKIQQLYPTTILNASGIYGSLRWRLIQNLATVETAKRLAGKLANQIHDDDLANFIVHLIHQDAHKNVEVNHSNNSLANRYIVSDGQKLTYAQMIAAMATTNPCFNRVTQLLKPILLKSMHEYAHADQHADQYADQQADQKHCLNEGMLAAGFQLEHSDRLKTYQTIASSLQQWQSLSHFQRQVLHEVSNIPYGQTRSYKDIANALNSIAYRAVGTALKKNPFAPDIPCHRVIGSQGQMIGFQGKTDDLAIALKKQLLDNEQQTIEPFLFA